jgi:hypothetical protein
MKEDAGGYLVVMLGAFILLVNFLYLAYWPWFQPREWRKRIWGRRRSIQQNWPFLPENVTYKFLRGRPKLDLWYARIGYLIMALIFIIIIVLMYWCILYVNEHDTIKIIGAVQHSIIY